MGRVRPAKQFGPIAIQTTGACFTLPATGQSEDCLSLNIWTASLDHKAFQPVMLWIHGGGNLGGAGSEDAYDGASLARLGVTVVTFNYRLGAFGFLAHPDAGDFAVLDVLMVLEWIAQNIGAFGGDPENVTTFGQSAGVGAVRTLLSTRRARGLFHRAIMQSAVFEPSAIAPPWNFARTQAATSVSWSWLAQEQSMNCAAYLRILCAGRRMLWVVSSRNRERSIRLPTGLGPGTRRTGGRSRLSWLG